PKTTGGSPMPVFTSATTRRRPGNGESASSTPAGTPASRLSSVAVAEISIDRHAIALTSGSPPTRRPKASRSPSQRRSIRHLPGPWSSCAYRPRSSTRLPASGTNRRSPYCATPKLPMRSWAAGETRKSAKARARRRDPPPGLGCVLQSCHLCGVVGRAHEEEVVVHHEPPVDDRALQSRLLLQLGRVAQHDVGLAPPREGERLAAPHGHRLHVVAARLLEDGHEDVEETRVLRAGRRRQHE